jgi:hypothetical protein
MVLLTIWGMALNVFGVARGLEITGIVGYTKQVSLINSGGTCGLTSKRQKFHRTTSASRH